MYLIKSPTHNYQPCNKRKVYYANANPPFQNPVLIQNPITPDSGKEISHNRKSWTNTYRKLMYANAEQDSHNLFWVCRQWPSIIIVPVATSPGPVPSPVTVRLEPDCNNFHGFVFNTYHAIM